MKLLIGLGNPGSRYEFTRHNAGWWVLDEIARVCKCEWDAHPSDRFKAHIGRGQVLGESVVCVKPTTYMNLSGKSVQPLSAFFKVPPSDWIVFQDDIDLADGKVKARVGGGHGGHNGIRSIIQETGHAEFKRLKLGVGRPVKLDGGEQGQSVADFVLQRVSQSDVERYVAQVMPDVWLRLKDWFR